MPSQKRPPAPRHLEAKGKAPRKPRIKRDGDGTRSRILQAAIKEFSEKGHGGARIDSVCRAGRVNPRMIYHYFGDKDGLYVAVLEHVLGELRSEELKLEVDHTGPLEGMLQLFEFVHGHFRKHPELIRLLNGENQLGARFLRRSFKTPVVASPLIELIDRLLARGAREGLFRTGIDPLQLYVMLVALCYFHRSNAHTLSTIFRTDLTKTAWQEAQKRHARLMVTRFLLRA